MGEKFEYNDSSLDSQFDFQCNNKKRRNNVEKRGRKNEGEKEKEGRKKD